MRADARVTDAGSFACGSTVCSPDELCVHPCSGVPVNDMFPPPAPFCAPRPASCATATTCTCPGGDAGVSDPCYDHGGQCVQVAGHDLTCGLCA
jgi:hypothetical protein